MIKIIIFLMILAVLHGRWETEIEGSCGWAEKLPTKRYRNRIINLLIGKEATLYHIVMLIMFLFIFHGAFLFINWSLKREMLLLSLYNIYWVLEDFSFFLVNKNFGLTKFSSKFISWHKRWIIKFLPVSYLWGLVLGLLFLLIAYLIK